MDSVLNFLADYYYIFLGVSVVLLIALIGFIVGSKKKKPAVETASATAQPNVGPTEPMGVQIDNFAPVTPDVTSTMPGPAPVTPETSTVTPVVNESVVNTPVAPTTFDLNQPNPNPVTSNVANMNVTPTPVVSDINAGMPLPAQPLAPVEAPTLVIPDPSAPASMPTTPTPAVPDATQVVEQPVTQAPVTPTVEPAGQSIFEVQSAQPQPTPVSQPQSLFEVQQPTQVASQPTQSLFEQPVQQTNNTNQNM